MGGVHVRFRYLYDKKNNSMILLIIQAVLRLIAYRSAGTQHACVRVAHGDRFSTQATRSRQPF
ncbi:hypothetical protein XAB3213_4720016 [Xanthomonas citri pv. bilvae]|nr:hypothetical protein XAB3213_4720016 [Xanthomonas citri pv. bilvae]